MARALPYLLLVLLACGRTAAPPKVPPAPEAAAMEPAPAAEPESVVARTDAEALGCPPVFPASVRATWQDISGERYRIDASGRPEQAIALLPPIGADARDEGCQGDVGRWGDALPGDDDYDGGHLIGAQLGGWGGRANMVPQIANFNRGNWLQMENAVASCAGELEDGQLRYTVTVAYDDVDTLVPSTMQMALDDLETEQSITLVFANAVQGGPDGTATRERGVQWLRDLGCE